MKLIQNEKISLDYVSVKKGYRFRWEDACRSSENSYRVFYIYQIKNIKNGRLYIGQTTDLLRRLKSHPAGLSSINKLGRARDWEVKILEIIKYDNSVSPNEAYKVLKCEEKLIKLAIAKYGRKCINSRSRNRYYLKYKQNGDNHE